MENCYFDIKCAKCQASAEMGTDSLLTPYTEGDIYLHAYINQLNNDNNNQKIILKCLKCGNEFEITHRVMFYR